MKRQLLLFVTMLLATIMPMKLWAADGNAEPYAVLSDNDVILFTDGDGTVYYGKTLKFYYDTQREARGGMSVVPFSYYTRPWSWEGLTTVVFDDSFSNCTTITSTAHWFEACQNLTSVIGINNLKTDNVTDMSNMFDNCILLDSLDLSKFNTVNVKCLLIVLV